MTFTFVIQDFPKEGLNFHYARRVLRVPRRALVIHSVVRARTYASRRSRARGDSQPPFSGPAHDLVVKTKSCAALSTGWQLARQHAVKLLVHPPGEQSLPACSRIGLIGDTRSLAHPSGRVAVSPVDEIYARILVSPDGGRGVVADKGWSAG